MHVWADSQAGAASPTRTIDYLNLDQTSTSGQPTVDLGGRYGWGGNTPVQVAAGQLNYDQSLFTNSFETEYGALPAENGVGAADAWASSPTLRWKIRRLACRSAA